MGKFPKNIVLPNTPPSTPDEFKAFSPRCRSPRLKRSNSLDFHFPMPAINTLQSFWTTRVIALRDNPKTRADYDELCVSLYTNMYTKVPSIRKLFPEKDLRKKSQHLMDLVSHIVEVVSTKKSKKCISKLKKLGKKHGESGLGPDFYELLIYSLHETLSLRFRHAYKFEVSFALDWVLTLATRVMCQWICTQLQKTCPVQGLPFDELVLELDWLSDMKSCLEDCNGSKYLEMFMEECVCGESMHFLNAYEHFHRTSLSGRDDMGRYIFDRFIRRGAELEVNISSVSRNEIYQRYLNESSDGMPADLFDSAASEVYRLIRMSIWPRFQNCLLNLLDLPHDFFKGKSGTTSPVTPRTPVETYEEDTNVDTKRTVVTLKELLAHAPSRNLW